MSSMVPISLRDPFWEDSHFSSARRDFEDMRRQMMKDAKDFWSKVDESSFDTSSGLGPQRKTSESFQSSSSTSRATTGSDMRQPTTSMPRWMMPDRPQSSHWASEGSSQVIRVKDDDEKFEITLDVHGFKPDELQVRTQPDNSILVQGKHEAKSNDSKTLDPSNISRAQSSVLQQFSRSFSLPANCDPLRVISNLSRDGVLVITAPKRIKLDRERNINIPISH